MERSSTDSFSMWPSLYVTAHLWASKLHFPQMIVVILCSIILSLSCFPPARSAKLKQGRRLTVQPFSQGRRPCGLGAQFVRGSVLSCMQLIILETEHVTIHYFFTQRPGCFSASHTCTKGPVSERGISAWDQVLSSLAVCSLIFTCTFLYPSVEVISVQCDLREDLANMVRNSEEYRKLVAKGLTPGRFLSCEAAEHLSGLPKDWTCASSTLCPQEIGVEAGLFDKSFVRFS